MKRVETGALGIDSKVEELLTHRSGLPAWRPFFESMRAKFGDRMGLIPREKRVEYFNSLLDSVGVEESLRGQVVYSDLGFLHLERLLGEYFERDLM